MSARPIHNSNQRKMRGEEEEVGGKESRGGERGGGEGEGKRRVENMEHSIQEIISVEVLLK